MNNERTPSQPPPKGEELKALPLGEGLGGVVTEITNPQKIQNYEKTNLTADAAHSNCCLQQI